MSRAQRIQTLKQTDERRLREEYQRLVQGLVTRGALTRERGGEELLANPTLPEDVLQETVPGERGGPAREEKSHPIEFLAVCCSPATL